MARVSETSSGRKALPGALQRRNLERPAAEARDACHRAPETCSEAQVHRPFKGMEVLVVANTIDGRLAGQEYTVGEAQNHVV